MNYMEALAKWRAENKSGNGYASPWGDTVKEALDAYANNGGRVKYYPRTTNEVGIVRHRGELLAIGDAHGPWVVVLEQSGADWTALGTEAGTIDRAEILRENGQCVRSTYDRSSAIDALNAECKNLGFDRAGLDPDDVDAYVEAYVAALNGEPTE